MNELSLFSGAGGGLLGTKLLGFKHIGYVEYNDYCQRVIAQRIKDGILDNAPIYVDIRAFIDSGRCELYRGVTDIITAGFPCQGFSVAGKQLAGKDPRNKWPETCEVIRRVRPGQVLLENSPGLITTGYIIQIFQDLKRIGYKIKPALRFKASDIGADHRRERVWIHAYSNSNRSHGIITTTSADPIYTWRGADIKRVVSQIQSGQTDSLPESWFVRKGHGTACRVDRTKAIGDMQVPAVAATAFNILSGEIQ